MWSLLLWEQRLAQPLSPVLTRREPVQFLRSVQRPVR
jgi:hypothetical protein